MAVAFFSIAHISMACGQICAGIEQLSASSSWKTELKSLLERFRALLLFCCIILITSTLSTSFFLRIGVSLEEDKQTRETISAISKAMGLHWGIVFTLMLAFMLIIPTWLVHFKLKQIYRIEKISKDIGTSFYDLRASSLEPLLQPSVAFSVIMPIATSLSGKLLSVF
ncbi:MAG: hypothetical protein ACOYMG_06960 [Candidatus Methylumidiphilus sp.]